MQNPNSLIFLSNNVTMEQMLRTSKPELQCLPGAIEKERLKRIAVNIIEPILLWGFDPVISSGYRSVALNTAIGGSKSSQHILGEAVDLVPGNKRTPKDLFICIVQCNIEVDQCIYENGWVHVSLRESNKNRREYLCKPWV